MASSHSHHSGTGPATAAPAAPATPAAHDRGFNGHHDDGPSAAIVGVGAPAIVAAVPGGRRRARIAWGAVIAGAILAATVTALLTLLGVGIGLVSSDTFVTADNLAIGAGIWYVVAGTAALFLGGWVAARLAGTPDKTDGLLHGLTTWGVSTLLAAWLATSVVGGLLSGIFGVANSALQATGTATAGIATATGNALGGVASATGDVASAGIGEAGDALAAIDLEIPWQSVENQTQNLLNEAGIFPGKRLEQAEDAPIQSAEQFAANVREFVGTVEQADRSDLVDFVSRNSSLSESEVDDRLSAIRDDYQAAVREAEAAYASVKSTAIDTYRDGKRELFQTYEQVEDQAIATARAGYSAGTDALGAAALWSFVVLLLGAGASAVGGWLGTDGRPAHDVAYA